MRHRDWPFLSLKKVVENTSKSHRRDGMVRGRSEAPERLTEPSLSGEEGSSSYQSDGSDGSDGSEISHGTASSDEADSVHSSDEDFVSDDNASIDSEGEYQDATDQSSDVMEDREDEDSDPDGISDGELEDLKDLVAAISLESGQSSDRSSNK
jgi:hypothetical protein